MCTATSIYISLSLGTSFFLIALFPPDLSYLSSLCSSVFRSMEDPTKSFDESLSFEDPVVPTWPTCPANATRSLSDILLDWGVEGRGACRISTSGPSRPDQRTFRAIPRTAFARPTPDRYPARRFRGQDRNTFRQNILHMVVCEYEHPVVRVPFLLITLVSRDLRFGSFVDS